MNLQQPFISGAVEEEGEQEKCGRRIPCGFYFLSVFMTLGAIKRVSYCITCHL